MTDTERENLKSLIRTEPTIRSTLADLEPELQAAGVHFSAIQKRVSEIRERLAEIDAAKTQIADCTKPSSAPTASEPKGEPVPE